MADNETGNGEASGSHLNPIACSHCRQRKRKCDRQLPHCLQCGNDPSNCHYPEQNKRGIPIGFINRLEARLTATEEALYRVLQFLDNGSSNEPNSVHQQSTQSKAGRIKEWDEFPLQSMDDIRKWYQQQTRRHSPSQRHSLEERPPPPTTPWPSDPFNQITVSATEMSPRNADSEMQLPTKMDGISPRLEMDGEATLMGSMGASNPPSESKAQNLRSKNPHLYF